MFHEKYLRDFLTVCETGNITAAAARLGLSQPALGNGDGQLPQQEACQGRCQECGESFHGKELLPRVQRMVCTVR